MVLIASGPNCCISSEPEAKVFYCGLLLFTIIIKNQNPLTLPREQPLYQGCIVLIHQHNCGVQTKFSMTLSTGLAPQRWQSMLWHFSVISLKEKI